MIQLKDINSYKITLVDHYLPLCI